MPNGYAVCYSAKYGKPGIAYGPYVKDGMTRVSVRGLDTKKLSSELENNYPAATTVKFKNRFCLLLISDTGKARLFRISDRGQFYDDMGDAQLSLTSPVKSCTSLAKVDEDTLLLAADNAIITLKQNENGWQETSRITAFGNAANDKFGDQLYVAYHSNRIWVSDMQRHRIVTLDSKGQNLLATYGKTDKAGNSIDELNQPTTIAVNGDRCVVFDSHNQRLMRFTFKATR